MKLLLLFLLLTNIIIANDMNEAMQAYTNDNKLKAAGLFEKEARKGNVAAQAMLGNMYFEGITLKKDCTKVIQWLQKPARQENNTARINLAQCYMEQKEYSKSIYWLKKASDSNNAQAQTILAKIYLRGIGVKKDEVKGVKYLKLAAKNKDKDATVSLALAYAKGNLGLVKNPNRAVEILSAISGYDPQAQYYLALIYYTDLYLIDKASFWMNKAIDNNFAPALYFKARGYAQNGAYYQALILYYEAAQSEKTIKRCKVLPAILDLQTKIKVDVKRVKNLLLEVDKNLQREACKQVWNKYKLVEY